VIGCDAHGRKQFFGHRRRVPRIGRELGSGPSTDNRAKIRFVSRPIATPARRSDTEATCPDATLSGTERKSCTEFKAVRSAERILPAGFPFNLAYNL
jgi:hypothetical protein